MAATPERADGRWAVSMSQRPAVLTVPNSPDEYQPQLRQEDLTYSFCVFQPGQGPWSRDAPGDEDHLGYQSEIRMQASLRRAPHLAVRNQILIFALQSQGMGIGKYSDLRHHIRDRKAYKTCRAEDPCNAYSLSKGRNYSYRQI